MSLPPRRKPHILLILWLGSAGVKLRLRNKWRQREIERERERELSEEVDGALKENVDLVS